MAEKELAEAGPETGAATARGIHKLAAENREPRLPDICTALKRGHVAIDAGRFCFGDIGLTNCSMNLRVRFHRPFAILASELAGAPKKPSPGRCNLPACQCPRPVIPPAPPIPRQSIFALKDIKWRNPARPQEYELGRAFQFANVPEALAHKALDLGVAVLARKRASPEMEIQQERRAADPEKCIDLETG